MNLAENLTSRAEETAARLGHPVFGAGIDPVVAGTKGGKASVLSRRLAGQRRLEEKIAATKNGQAIYHLLRLRLERERELEAARLQADRDLAEMDMLLLTVREQVDEALEQRAQLDAELAEREARLEAVRRGDDDALAHLLRDVGAERCERALVELEWLEAEA